MHLCSVACTHQPLNVKQELCLDRAKLDRGEPREGQGDPNVLGVSRIVCLGACAWVRREEVCASAQHTLRRSPEFLALEGPTENLVCTMRCRPSAERIVDKDIAGLTRSSDERLCRGMYRMLQRHQLQLL